MKRFLETVLICVIVGAGFAGLVGWMNLNGIIVDEYVNATTTITDIQTGIVFLWVIAGAILGVIRK